MGATRAIASRAAVDVDMGALWRGVVLVLDTGAALLKGCCGAGPVGGPAPSCVGSGGAPVVAGLSCCEERVDRRLTEPVRGRPAAARLHRGKVPAAGLHPDRLR